MRDLPSRLGLALACLTLLATATTADARPRPRAGKKFEANKTFGIGVMIGSPTALSGKYFYASDKAFDFGIGGEGGYRDRSGLHLHADHLWHPVSLASTPAFELPLYLGVGLRLFDFDHKNDHGTAIGVRVPFGIAFDFNNVPMDIFFEVAPVLDFFYDYGDNVGFDVNVSLGARYWF